MTSPLANLTSVLREVLEATGSYRDVLSRNEASTRAVLIDPVLRELGWNLGNPFMVEVEKAFEEGFVDYALSDQNQETVTIIEAKKLGTDLENRKIYMALVKYAFSVGTSNIFLTDGITWKHYETFNPEAEASAKTFSLVEDDLVEIAAYLVQKLDAEKYWSESKDVDQLAQEVSQLRGEINTLKAEFAKLPSAGERGILPLEENTWEKMTNSLVSLGDVGSVKGTKPSLLRLPDGRIITVETWTDVLVQCCEFVLDREQGIGVPLKDAAGRTVNLLSDTRPPKGITYYEMQYENRKIFLYTNYEANNCVRNSLYLLGRLSSRAGLVSEPAVVFD